MENINAATIVLWLLSHGYHEPQREAIVQYVKLESRFQPCIHSRTGHYLFQWVSTRRHRLETQAKAADKVTHGNCPHWEFQMEFMDREIKQTISFARFLKEKDRFRAFRVFRNTFGKGH